MNMRTAAALLFLIQTTDFSAEGLKALDERRYDAAVQSFTAAIAADAKDYSAHFNLALAYGFLNRDDEGIAEYRKTLELKPGLAPAEVNQGILLFRQKRPADALPLFEDAIRQKPKDFQSLYYLAQCQLETGALAKAEESFRGAIEINSKSAAAELGLAHDLALQRKLADAAPHFRQAAQLDAGHRDALLELADLYERNQQIPEALAIYREFPDDAAVQEHAGELMLRNNQYADAIPSLEQAYARGPTAANRVALAMAYQFNKQNEKALPLFDKAAAADPANFDVRMMYARCLRDAKQYPAAVRQFNEAVKIKPGDMHAWSDLASMLYINGDLPDALAAFDRARQLGENTSGNWFLRAIILDKLKQLKPALEAYRQFLTMSHGENADQEFQARQRARIIQNELEKR
jgi:tetratricopeptide (TPR) repeat protein